LFEATPLKAQNNKNARNLTRMPPLATPLLAGDLAPAGTTSVTPAVNV